MSRTLATLLALALPLAAPAKDWTTWGGDGSRNMVAHERKAPKSFDLGDYLAGQEQVDLSTTEGVRWVAKLGSQTYGNPVVADGIVFVGTNNAAERRPGFEGDYSVVLAFDEATGDFLWQHTIPKLGSGKVNDWEFLGTCSSPAVVDEFVYVVTTRGQVVALDRDGLRDGNQGVTTEGSLFVGPGKAPVELMPEVDADVLWVYDMPAELGVFPHNVTSSSPLVVGDKLYIVTSNGTDWSHLDLPSPFSPTLVVFDRKTGELLGEEVAGISERTMHANWSSPSYVAEHDTVLFGAGDGFLYGFDPEPTEIDGLPALAERWRVDGNLPTYRTEGGVPRKYATAEGPSEYIGTPVYADGLVYTAIGQDPEHGPGVGLLTAVKPGGEGDVTGSHVAWRYDGISRSISTVAVHDGIVYAADYDGRLHALDAATGEPHWVHETRAHIWGSPYVAGKRVFLGDEDGILWELAAGEELEVLAQHALPAPIYSTPVLANRTLFVATQTHLYAIDGRRHKHEAKK